MSSDAEWLNASKKSLNGIYKTKPATDTICRAWETLSSEWCEKDRTRCVVLFAYSMHSHVCLINALVHFTDIHTSLHHMHDLTTRRNKADALLVLSYARSRKEYIDKTARNVNTPTH